MMKKTINAMILVALVLLLAGCASRPSVQSFSRTDASLAHIQAVAVLPFEGSDTAPRVREFAMTQVLAQGLFDVIDKGRVDSFLAQEAIAPGTPLDAPTLRRLGQIINVQAFMLGSVEQGSDARGSAVYPEISMTLRLIDAETGVLLWQASGRGSGYSLADRLFGLAPKDHFQVTMDLLARLLATMG
ncbi:hypothetical protein [Pelovirga terrestris]|uniref:Penicillin-binding protein activator LpoB n=1 Tax=Pelovirga terrestris TaxID=2771352 RepID=A0A8J6UIK1_9BACT|nr:hypothetical protein [Pelovirga terrestris]MBD1401100.1 hypothetical protein [Pelovirga terrestris]